MKQKIAVVLFTVTAGLHACSSNQIMKESTVFLTRITDSGLKHFEVQIKRDKSRNQAEQRTRGGPQRKEPRVNSDRLEKALVKAADDHIKTNHFCSTGFWIIETNTYAPNLSLRGECNELASEEDKSQYPDTIKMW